jgi:hypothetical protein
MKTSTDHHRNCFDYFSDVKKMVEFESNSSQFFMG